MMGGPGIKERRESYRQGRGLSARGKGREILFNSLSFVLGHAARGRAAPLFFSERGSWSWFQRILKKKSDLFDSGSKVGVN